jgi:hypothetical protein
MISAWVDFFVADELVRKYQGTVFAMKYVLILLFTCGQGCGSPPQIKLPTSYATLQSCLVAGNDWISPRSNPTRAVRDFRCELDSGRKSRS